MSEHTLHIELDGKCMVSGDETSVRVFYKNLTGDNFQDSPVWRDQTYAQYLAMMEREWGTDLEPGREIGLYDGEDCLNAHFLSVWPDRTMPVVAPKTQAD